MRRPYSDRYDGIQLKIESKKLKSGRFQVKFYTQGLSVDDYYGYMLVEANKTLREVVKEIKERISNMGDIGSYYQRHLYSIGQYEGGVKETFVIFKN